MKKMMISGAILALSLQLVAAPKKAESALKLLNQSKVSAYTEEMQFHNETTAKVLNPEAFKKESEEAEKRAKRSVAAVEDIQGPYKEYRDRLLKIRNTPGEAKGADELDMILKDFNDEATYEKFPTDLKFFAAQLAPLRAYRGFFYRVRPLVQDSAMLQSSLVTMVKSVASNVYTHFEPYDSGKINGNQPTEHMLVLFRYMSEPYNDIRMVNGKPYNYGTSVIQSEAQLQAWFANNVYKAIETSAKRIEAIDLRDKKIPWDNKIIFGSEMYEKSVDRMRMVGETERKTLLASLYGSMANIDMLSAYSIGGEQKRTGGYAPGLVDVSREIGHLYGYDAFSSKLGGGVHISGGAADARTEKVMKIKSANPNFLTLKPGPVEQKGSGRWFMHQAYENLNKSYEQANLARIEVSGKPADMNMVLDPGFYGPASFNSVRSYQNVSRMLAGDNVPVRSAVSDDTVRVSLNKFFNDPPEDLTKFLPTDFSSRNEREVATLSDVKDSDGKPVAFRNYFYGRATSWNTSAYSKYFPDATTNEGVIKTTRTLGQSIGGPAVGIPLGMIIQ